MRNLYACLILLIQLWAMKIGVKIFTYQKFCRYINISSFFKSGIQYLWQGKISVCKVLVPIKVMPVKNDYFLLSKFELHSYQQMNGFLYWHSFYWKKIGAYVSHKLIVRLITT